MPTPIHVTLLIADLLPPAGFALPVATPAIDALLKRATVEVSAGQPLEEALLALFNRPTDGTGVAALTRVADFAEAAPGVWLRADPVHLAVSRDNVQLFDSHVISPTAAEMADIGETLNRHLGDGGRVITFPDPARGYLPTTTDDLPLVSPLWRMSGANIFDHLALTKTRTNWRALANEIQMLLHDHPVNVARAAAGTPAINGLWIWGGGEDVVSTPSGYHAVFARLALARGLALTDSISLISLPEEFAQASFAAAENLVVLHQATREVRSQNREAWAAQVAEIDRRWIAPAMTALDTGKIASLTLHLPNDVTSLTATATRRHPLQWLRHHLRANKRLAEYA
jgi:hypothetical protein